MKIKMRPPDARQLMKEIEAHLPLPVYVTPEVADTLRQKGNEVDDGEEFQVTSVMDSGEMGGIMCATQSKDKKTVFWSSLTHLRIGADHPLKASIVAYQIDRVRKLARQRS